MSFLLPRIVPVIGALLIGARHRGRIRFRVLRDAVLWLRAPADRRPVWSDRG